MALWLPADIVNKIMVTGLLKVIWEVTILNSNFAGGRRISMTTEFISMPVKAIVVEGPSSFSGSD